jgi:hypothetical protein
MKDSGIKDYKIISEHDTSKVEATVNRMITDNWAPWGNLIVSTPVLNNDEVAPLFTQVMIKNKTTRDNAR